MKFRASVVNDQMASSAQGEHKTKGPEVMNRQPSVWMSSLMKRVHAGLLIWIGCCCSIELTKWRALGQFGATIRDDFQCSFFRKKAMCMVDIPLRQQKTDQKPCLACPLPARSRDGAQQDGDTAPRRWRWGGDDRWSLNCFDFDRETLWGRHRPPLTMTMRLWRRPRLSNLQSRISPDLQLANQHLLDHHQSIAVSHGINIHGVDKSLLSSAAMLLYAWMLIS